MKRGHEHLEELARGPSLELLPKARMTTSQFDALHENCKQMMSLITWEYLATRGKKIPDTPKYNELVSTRNRLVAQYEAKLAYLHADSTIMRFLNSLIRKGFDENALHRFMEMPLKDLYADYDLQELKKRAKEMKNSL